MPPPPPKKIKNNQTTMLAFKPCGNINNSKKQSTKSDPFKKLPIVCP